MRDDFGKETKQILARRVGIRCSNPNCRKLTSGPQEDTTKTINIGVAAHITAASSDGPRFDQSLSSEERKSLDNGIWLCQNCAKLIDSDERRYTVSLLMEWKRLSEQASLLEIESNLVLDKDASAIQEVARVFASKLEQHWLYMNHIQQLLLGFMFKPYEMKAEIKATALRFNLEQLKQDEVYRTAHSKIGIFPGEVVDYPMYDLQFRGLLDVLSYAANIPQSLESETNLQRLCIQIIFTRIDCVLCLAILNKKILDEVEKLMVCKEYLRSEYERVREALSGGENIPKVIFSSLRSIEILFTKFGLTHEIEPFLIHPEDL